MIDDNDDDTVGRAADQFPLRFPDGMRAEIKATAKANGRSMNAEIVAALERHFAAGAATVQMKLRLPAALHKRIDDAAWMGRRTMNAQAVLMLESAFVVEDQARRANPYPAAMLADVEFDHEQG